MSLSLEVKKFINSEHTGQFISVVLPSELPVVRSEVREVNRDRSAANSARTVADNKARIASKAREKAESTLRVRNSKQDEFNEARELLADLKAKREDLRPDLEEKREQYESSRADFERKNRVFIKAREEYLAVESRYKAASDAESAAERYLEESRSKKTNADQALVSAREGDEQSGIALTTAKSDAEDAKRRYDAAKADYDSAAGVEAIKDEEYRAFVNSVAQLLAVQKEEARKAADCQKALAAAAKELTKASGEYSSASEAVSTAEIQLNSNPKFDTDAQRNKLMTLRQRQAAAKVRFDAAQAASTAAEEQARKADAARNEALNRYSEENERLLACKAQLDELKAKTQAAANAASEAKKRYDALTHGYEKSQNAVKTAAENVKGREQDVSSATERLARAEEDIKVKKEAAAGILEELERLKAIMEEKAAISKKSEKIYRAYAGEYEKAQAEFDAADAEYEHQHDICSALNRDLEALDAQLQADRKAARAAADVAAELEEEAQKLRSSVRTISTKYETANIHYLQQGVGEDIILIHSIGQSLYTFRELINKLSGNFRVTALDLVGFGYSDKPYYFDYTMDEMADFIERFMSELNINTANFFGFSMGAGYVINFAKRYPERVERLVLLSPGGITPDMPSNVRMMQGRLFGGLATRLFNMKAQRKMLTECFFDLTNLTDDLMDEYYRPISSTESRRVIHTCLINYDDEAILNSLRDVGAQTLLLWGNEDKWHPTEMADIFRNVLPNVTYNVVRNAGHLAHEEKADRVAYLIKTFIPCGYEE